MRGQFPDRERSDGCREGRIHGPRGARRRPREAAVQGDKRLRGRVCGGLGDREPVHELRENGEV